MQEIVVITVAELRAIVRDEVSRALRADARRNARVDTYVTSEALQQRFGISRATVHNWVHNRGCPHEMRGKILRFNLAAVEAWFAAKARPRGGKQ